MRHFDYSDLQGADRAKLKTIETVLRAGLSQTAARQIDKYGKALSSSSSSQVRSIFQEMIASLDHMREMEKTYGVGAMLDTSRPLVMHLLKATKKSGEPAISKSMLEAMERATPAVRAQSLSASTNPMTSSTL